MLAVMLDNAIKLLSLALKILIPHNWFLNTTLALGSMMRVRLSKDDSIGKQIAY